MHKNKTDFFLFSSVDRPELKIFFCINIFGFRAQYAPCKVNVSQQELGEVSNTTPPKDDI